MKANNEKYPESLTDKENDRFWSKVNKDGPICDLVEGPCWVWIAGLKNNGYGDFKLRGKTILSHRLAYTITSGTIDEALKLDHLCRNRNCVNPDHLEVVTQGVNVTRGTMMLRESQKTHCPRKHLLEGDNLVPSRLKKGWRICLACSRAFGYIQRKGGSLQEVSDHYYAKICEGSNQKLLEKELQ